MKKLKILSEDYSIVKLRRADIQSLIPFIPSANEVVGSSPPEIFVGRSGYPKVFIGPLIPPFLGRTEHLCLTETWFGKELDEIVRMRIQLIRGKKLLNVLQVDERYAQELREAMLSETSVDMEAKLSSSPRGFLFSEDHQPFGPSASLEYLKISPGRTDFRIERAYYDRDLTSTDAVIELYKRGVPVSRIQQGLSAGLFGVKRRFVPTRWSITAVDDIISKHIIEKIKEYPTINEFRVYYTEYIKNKWAVIMLPEMWSYESIEAWFPGTLAEWMGIAGDYEPFNGRKEYASMGGCYYAGRLAVAERLFSERRQASVLILREIHPGYIPTGVWNVRETVRNLLRRKPYSFSSLEECLSFIGGKLSLPVRIWMENSTILRSKKETLNDFLM
ncbi:MAG: Nre family DNA repair protein [Candidatus Methanodesulfokora sp.]|jgi:hypothetical protein